MISFKSKPIDNVQSLAEILKEARGEQKTEFSKIEKITKINKKYLMALEEGDYKKLPSEIYIKNFTKSYGEYLGLDTNELLKILNKELEIYYKINDIKDSAKSEKINNYHLIFTPKLIKNIIIGILIAAVVGIISWEIEKIETPPRLTITYPESSINTSEKNVTLVGDTEPGAELSINNQPALPDPNGHFSQKIDLKDGLNTIVITAKKKHSRENVIYRQIIVEEPQIEILTTPPAVVAPAATTTPPAVPVTPTPATAKP